MHAAGCHPSGALLLLLLRVGACYCPPALGPLLRVGAATANQVQVLCCCCCCVGGGEGGGRKDMRGLTCGLACGLAWDLTWGLTTLGRTCGV